MSKHEGRRVAAVVMLMLSLSTIGLYVSMKAAVSPVAASAPPASVVNRADAIRSDSNRIISEITTALQNKDFVRARSYAGRLAPAPTRNYMLAIVDAADTRGRVEQVASYIRGTHYENARLQAGSLADKRAARELLGLIDFAEARTALARGDISTASKLAQRLQPGLKRAILFIALASHVTSDPSDSVRYVRSAVANLSQIDVPFRRRVLTMAARVLLEVDVEYGLATLDRAIHEREPSNIKTVLVGPGQRSGATSISIAGGAFIELIRLGGASEAFSLVIPGTAADLGQLVIEQHGRLRCFISKYRADEHPTT